MSNNNPAEMSNEDLEKDMQQNDDEASGFKNDENVNKSTAAEGTLKSASQDANSKTKMDIGYNADEEQDLDDLSHSPARIKASGSEEDMDDVVHQKLPAEDNQDGSIPDPEELDQWENRDTKDKMSG